MSLNKHIYRQGKCSPIPLNRKRSSTSYFLYGTESDYVCITQWEAIIWIYKIILPAG